MHGNSRCNKNNIIHGNENSETQVLIQVSERVKLNVCVLLKFMSECVWIFATSRAQREARIEVLPGLAAACLAYGALVLVLAPFQAPF